MIAQERIDRLIELARAATKAGEIDRARSYVRLARRIAERNQLSLPHAVRRWTCGSCDQYLIPGRNARVRTRDGYMVVTCECGSQERFPYKS